MLKFKLFNIAVTLIYRLIIYCAALSLLAGYFVVFNDLTPLERFVKFLGACFSGLFILIFLPALCIKFLPKLQPGTYELGGKEFYLSLLHDSFREVHSSSGFLNGIINRMEGLRFIIYRMYGSRVLGYFSLSSNTQLLSPSLMTFGPNSFIAMNTLVSCHSIKRNKFWVYPFSIGKGSAIGAECKIACGAQIGDYTYLDTGIKMSFNVKLGNNVKVLSFAEINDHVQVGDKSVIGKLARISAGVRIGHHSLIGEIAAIEDNVIIGNNVRVGNAAMILKGAVIEDGAKLCTGAFVPEGATVKAGEVYTRTYLDYK